MAGAEDLAPRHVEMGSDDPADPDLLAERVLDRVREGAPRARKAAQRAREDPLELLHAAFVEDDRVEVGWIDAGRVETPFDGARRERGVVLAARQPLLLDGGHGHAIDDE